MRLGRPQQVAFLTIVEPLAGLATRFLLGAQLTAAHAQPAVLLGTQAPLLLLSPVPPAAVGLYLPARPPLAVRS